MRHCTVLPHTQHSFPTRRSSDLQSPNVLKTLGFNQREIQFLARHPWWELPSLYFDPYLDKFTDEYRPFDAGLNHLDQDRKSTRLNSSHGYISYAVFCLKKKNERK